MVFSERQTGHVRIGILRRFHQVILVLGVTQIRISLVCTV